MSMPELQNRVLSSKTSPPEEEAVLLSFGRGDAMIKK